ncbi:hypothetical protein [Tabrizicola sp. BL-A-41-H6]|uniref:hypothetical protein n=1 Tax=Tabrizicola sp. BL-A-41-H6 TaxID=3421107 RepID=UPI003D67B7FE
MLASDPKWIEYVEYHFRKLNPDRCFWVRPVYPDDEIHPSSLVDLGGDDLFVAVQLSEEGPAEQRLYFKAETGTDVDITDQQARALFIALMLLKDR